MVAWYTPYSARLRPEPIDAQRRWRLLPGAHLSPDARRALDDARIQPVPGPRPIALHAYDRNGLVVVHEATWQWVVDRMPPDSRARYRAWRTQ